MCPKRYDAAAGSAAAAAPASATGGDAMATAIVIERGSGAGSVFELITGREGWTAERAGDADAALDRLADDDFEVLVAEADAIRGDWVATVRERYPNLPVVLVTPHGRQDEGTVKALLLGAATFVPRDRLARDLVATVERIVAMSCVDEAPAVGALLAETRHRYVLPNDRESLAPIVRHIQAELERFGVCDRPDRLRVAVAVEEALINAIVHGNLEVSSELRERADDAYERAIAERKAAAPYRDRRATLAAAYRPGEAAFAVADEGPGFNPAAVPDPTDPENLAKPHGRGLLLMRTFMDEVRHNAKGNEVTLVRRAKG